MGRDFWLHLHVNFFLLDQALDSVIADICGLDLSVCLLVSFNSQGLERLIMFPVAITEQNSCSLE